MGYVAYAMNSFLPFSSKVRSSQKNKAVFKGRLKNTNMLVISSTSSVAEA
jgi:hypothetical protein